MASVSAQTGDDGEEETWGFCQVFVRGKFGISPWPFRFRRPAPPPSPFSCRRCFAHNSIHHCNYSFVPTSRAKLMRTPLPFPVLPIDDDRESDGGEADENDRMLAIRPPDRGKIAPQLERIVAEIDDTDPVVRARWSRPRLPPRSEIRHHPHHRGMPDSSGADRVRDTKCPDNVRRHHERGGTIGVPTTDIEARGRTANTSNRSGAIQNPDLSEREESVRVA